MGFIKMQNDLTDNAPGASHIEQPTPAAPDARGWPIKFSIASVVVLSMAILALTIITLGWMGARESLLHSASRSARDAGLLISEKSQRMIEPAQATLFLLTSTVLAEAKTLDTRLQRLRTLTDVLAADRLISAVYVGYGDGSFFLAGH